MAEGFTLNIKADSGDFDRTLSKMEQRLSAFAKRASQIKIGFAFNGNMGKIGNSKTANSNLGNGIVLKESRSLAIAFEKCRQSVLSFNNALLKKTSQIGAKNSGTINSKGQRGLLDYAMAFPGLTQLVGMVSAPIKQMISTGFSTAQNNEKLRTDLSVLLGSDSAGADMSNRILDYAKSTPYAQEDLAGMAKMLAQYGAGIDETEKYMKQIGDIAMGSRQSMQGLGLVLGQVRSQGRITGQDLMQFINAGFNPLSVISEKTGKSMADLREMMSKGQISFDMVAAALESATSEGGKFYKGAERGSKTLQGLISTLKDNFGQALAKAIENNMDKIKTAFETLANFNFEQLTATISDLVRIFAKVGGWFIKIANSLNEFFVNLGGMGNRLLECAGAAIAIATALGSLGSVSKIVLPVIQSLVPAFGGLQSSILPMVGKAGLIGVLAGEIIYLTTALIEAHNEARKAKKQRQEIKEDGNIRTSLIDAYLNYKAGKTSEATYRDLFERAKGLGADMSMSWIDLDRDVKNSNSNNQNDNVDFSKLFKNTNVNMNVKNSVNQTNNISTDFNDIGRLIGENLDAILVSRLNFRTNAELAKAAAL